MEDLYKSIDELHAKVDKLLKSTLEPSKHLNAVSKAELYKALAAAQGEMGDMQYTGVNQLYHDKYVTYGDLVEMTRPALSKNGLAIIQDVFQDEQNHDVLRTTLAHSSGQTVSSTIRVMPNKNTLHQIGSYFAYVRKITYAALIGVMVHDMDDDDGHAAMSDAEDKKKKGVFPALHSKDTNTKEYKRLTKNELIDLEQSMGEHYDLGEAILEQYGIDSLADIPSSKYTYILAQMRKNIAYRDGTLLS